MNLKNIQFEWDNNVHFWLILGLTPTKESLPQQTMLLKKM